MIIGQSDKLLGFDCLNEMLYVESAPIDTFRGKVWLETRLESPLSNFLSGFVILLNIWLIRPLSKVSGKKLKYNICVISWSDI